jgi:hypothetical protein
MSGAEWAVRCPTHGVGVAAASSHGGSGTDSVAEHDHNAEHPKNHGARHNCSCPGPGCCAPAVAVVPATAVPMAHVALVHEAIAVSTLELFTSVSDYLHPFATAPPALALAPAALDIG